MTNLLQDENLASVLQVKTTTKILGLLKRFFENRKSWLTHTLFERLVERS